MTKRWSIRTLVAGAIIGPMVVLALVLVTIGTLTSRRIAEELGQRVLTDATEELRSQLVGYLQVSVQKSDLYTRRIQCGGLPVGSDLSRWERMMLDDLATSPQVASICFSNEAGDSTWLLRHGDRMELGRSSGANGCAAVEYEIAADGTIKPEPLRRYTYDGRGRPWYKAAAERAGSGGHWTPVYFWFGEGGKDTETGTGYTRPIHGNDGKLVGVLVIDTTLSNISRFLRRLPVADLGYVFIVDESGALVAASHGDIISKDGKRLTLSNVEHPAGRAASAVLASMSTAVNDTTETIFIAGKPARTRVVNLRPFEGVNWRAVIVLPDASFMSTANLAQRQAISVASAMIVVSLLLALFLARAQTRPLLQLSDHVRKVGEGDFASRLNLSAARELAALSDDLNKMAEDLDHRGQLQQSLALATQVQQSLLPVAAPKLKLLDVYGSSQYCDSTGGDYFDYIEVSPMPEGAALAVIGDVMGHGIAAALLMATARASLRSTAMHTASLSELMNTTNAVLTRDNRHGRFMTMLLVSVEPRAGRVRWVSAGHDAPLLFDPAVGAFTELSDGEMPLGVSADVVYQEYTYESLRPGQIVVMGTDGIWEAWDVAGKPFGKQAMRDVIAKHAHESAESLGRAIEAALKVHAGGRTMKDDVTLVVVKVK